MDLVSIVIPAHEPTGYLLETIACARKQTYARIEIVLVDDGSSQLDSQSILKTASRDADIYITQPATGLPGARNAGFRAAHGRYIVPLDADDMIQPEYVSACVAALENAPDAAFAYTAYEVFGTRSYIEEPGEYNLYRLLDQNFLTCAATVYKQDWEQAGGYDESMRFGYEDWEFWLRLGAHHRYGLYVPRTLFKYRKHGASLFDVALSKNTEIKAYIERQHPELYEYRARAALKKYWEPAACVISPTQPTPQTIIDVRIAGDDLSGKHAVPLAFLMTESGNLDPESAELAALAVWSGRSNCRLPDGSVALSGRDAGNSNDGKPAFARSESAEAASNPPIVKGAGLLRRHLANAELLSMKVWLSHPWRSAMRLVPLRIKEAINKAARRRVFDLSFYLQFQPGSLIIENSLIRPLQYFPMGPHERSRVALVTPHLGPGGAEEVLLEIASALSRERFEVLLLVTQSRDSQWLSRWRSRVEHIYDLAAAVAHEQMSATVFTIVSNWKCDVVLVQNSLSGYVAIPPIKSSVSNTIVIDLIHGLDDRWDQISLTADIGRHIDLRIATSSAVKNRLLQAGTSPERVCLIRHGVDLNRFRAAPVNPERIRNILFVGRLDPVKRPLLLTKIAARLAELRGARDFKVIVAGTGPEEAALHDSVRRAGLESVFDFRGHVDDVPHLYADCHVCVLPSRAEGIPLVVLEALASSRPVVASNVGAIGEVLDSSCGLLIDVGPNESDTFAAAINTLLDQPDVRTRMGQAGRRKIESEFDLRRTRDAYLQVLDLARPDYSKISVTKSTL